MSEAILDDVIEQKPDYALISGDFTQRARASQFEEAAAFLKRLPCPFIAIPGNHDIPLYHWPLRFLQPLRGYRRHINTDPDPILVDSEICVVGLNTVTRWRWKEGRVRSSQIKATRKTWLSNADRLRILMMHHPPSEGFMKLSKILGEKPDLILSGHLHQGGATLHPDGPLLIAAGTAISNRLRGGQANAYNVIEVLSSHPHAVRVETRAWNKKSFEPIATQSFEGVDGKWKLTSGPAAVHVEVSSGHS